MNRDLVFSPEAEQDLIEIQGFISDESSGEQAANYVDRIFKHCKVLAAFPSLGIAREDVRPGLRVTGFERRVTIAFNQPFCLPTHGLRDTELKCSVAADVSFSSSFSRLLPRA